MTTTVTTTVSPWTWQDAFGYSQSVAVRSPEVTVYVAGQASIDADGTFLHAGDMAGQVGQVLDNVETVLAAHDLTLADVVSYAVHTTDVDAYLPASGQVAERFAAHGRLPAGEILCEVQRLALPPMLAEIGVVAAR